MKYFLLDYDHDTREVSVTPIDDTAEALAAYSEREREALGSSHEVVLFYGESEEHLRRTHARYFFDLGEIAERVLDRFNERAASISTQTSAPA